MNNHFMTNGTINIHIQMELELVFPRGICDCWSSYCLYFIHLHYLHTTVDTIHFTKIVIVLQYIRLLCICTSDVITFYILCLSLSSILFHQWTLWVRGNNEWNKNKNLLALDMISNMIVEMLSMWYNQRTYYVYLIQL